MREARSVRCDLDADPARLADVSGARAPDLGTFVADLERALAERGHELARAVVDRRGGKIRHLALARDVFATARRFRPDVVYAHFLVPAGLLAAVETARPARRHRPRPGRRERAAQTRRSRRDTRRRPARRLRRRRLGVAPAAPRSRSCPERSGKTHVIDCGVDLDRFAPRAQAEARARVGWQPEGTGLPLRRLADRAQERAAARARVRAARRGRARLRRRRPAATGARGTRRGSGSPEPSPHEQVAGLGRSGRRRLPAEPRRAVRSRDARGDGRRPAGRRDPGRRAAGVRPARSGRDRRPRGRRGSRRGARPRQRRCRGRTTRAARQPPHTSLDTQAARIEELLVRAAGR